MREQRLCVASRALIWTQLALHPVHLRGRDRGRRQQRLGREAVVALLVLGCDAALIGEPDLDARPVVLVAGQQLVGASRRPPSAQRQMGRAAVVSGPLELALDVGRSSGGDRLGIRTGGQPRHGSSVRAAVSAGM